MCGGYSIASDLKKIGQYYLATPPRHNFIGRVRAAPAEVLPVILSSTPNQITFARWGFRPTWQNQPSKLLINARKESLLTKSTFKTSFKNQRCLVLTDGFLEWQKTASGSVAYRISLSSGEPFALAGLWRLEKVKNKMEAHFVIITTEPNAKIAAIHNRMPAIIFPEQKDLWLETQTKQTHVFELLATPKESKFTVNKIKV